MSLVSETGSINFDGGEMLSEEAIKNEIDSLLKMGDELFLNLEGVMFRRHYPLWYGKSLPYIHEYNSLCYNDFIMCFKNETRKEITASTYTLSDYIIGVYQVSSGYQINVQYAVRGLLDIQIGLLNACISTIDGSLNKLKNFVRADLFYSELESAEYLCQNKFYRAAGNIAGIVIERHLIHICNDLEIVLPNKPTLGVVIDRLYDADRIDDVEKLRLKHLNEIRVKCDHVKETEPNEAEAKNILFGARETLSKNYV
ncbi:MAG: hypothetical protein OEM52_00775 [bacterium]|nr:hypothetical protein [bacterium]